MIVEANKQWQANKSVLRNVSQRKAHQAYTMSATRLDFPCLGIGPAARFGASGRVVDAKWVGRARSGWDRTPVESYAAERGILSFRHFR
jgi:hypothetical protein